MDKNIKISILIAVIMIVSAFVYSNRSNQNSDLNMGVIPFMAVESEGENDLISGTYFARFFSPEGRDQLFKLFLKPTKLTVNGGRASLSISFYDDKDYLWKLGGWKFLENGNIRVTFSGMNKGQFNEPEILEFTPKDNLLIATKYDKNIYNTENLQFSKKVISSELKDVTGITLCGKKMKADSLVFGGFDFTKTFERVIQESPNDNLCGNEKNISLNFFDEILGIDIKEWRWKYTGGYIPKEEGPVNTYIISLYSKSNKHQANNSFNQSIFIYKFDFDKKEISEQKAFDGSFSVLGKIKDSDFNDNLKKISIVDSLFLYFSTIDEKSDIKEEQTDFRWNNGDGYNILIPSEESFIINKIGVSSVGRKFVTDTYFKEELSLVEKVFLERGFIFNQTNSSTSTSDTSFYDYIQAYKKGSELCRILINPDNTSLNISCGNAFDEAYSKQIPFLKAIEASDSGYKNISVRLRNQSGDFFQVGVGGHRGGSTAVIKKEGETYRVLLLRQEAPYCELIEKEKIPSEVLSSIGKGGCFEDNGTYRHPTE